MKLKTREKLQTAIKIGAVVLALAIFLGYIFSSFIF